LQLAAEKTIVLKQRPYRSSDTDGMFLVIGATDDEMLNRQINADAERRAPAVQHCRPAGNLQFHPPGHCQAR
jgi:siroheme synthase (precorrin-2 oxidase/ferrochelatase)